MNYLYLSAVVIGGLVVNCGVMMVLRILGGRIIGVVSVFLGSSLLMVSVVTVAQEAKNVPLQPTPETLTQFRTPIVNGLTVRTGPGEEYKSAKSIWQVNRGDKLHVVEDTLGWIRFHIKYFDPNWSGWVAKSYTTLWKTHEEMQRIEQLHEKKRR